ncbi:YesL family protein [Heyndrickxia sporothermodurans]
MNMNTVVGKFYSVSEKVMKIFYIHILWIGFSLLGEVILGFFPATVSMFSVLRKWLMNEETGITRLFWNTYRMEFVKANKLGGILVLLAYLLYVNFSLSKLTSGFTHLIIFLFLLMLIILFCVLLLYIFPVYVHFDMKIREYLSLSIMLGISFPFHTILMVIGCTLLYIVFSLLPGLIPFVSISLIGIVIMFIALNVFKRIHTGEVQKVM